MDEMYVRYRFPPDVYHAYRNVMDPVLHNRICRAARMRHGATRPCMHDPEAAESTAKPFQVMFNEYWKRISQHVTTNLSASLSMSYWLEEMQPILTLVNQVRSDRGPLCIKDCNDEFWIAWLPASSLERHEQLLLFQPPRA